MADLNTQTLFGEESEAELVPWPVGYGNRPQRVERTLFDQMTLWRTVPWPKGYGSA